MLLPPPIFAEVWHHVRDHNTWHVARQPGQQQLRAQLPGVCRATLAGINEPGSGCDFLEFHRRMMRHFASILRQVNYRPFTFEPWRGPRLPTWVETEFARRRPTFDLGAAYQRIGELVAGGDVDELGGFIEPNRLHAHEPGAGLHNTAHHVLAEAECERFCGDDTATMDDLGRSPGNVLFWLLHGWIDDRYLAWQQRRGETPDLTPMLMAHLDVTTEERATLDP